MDDGAVPTIRVEDWNELPALATLYVSGDNELNVDDVFAKVKSLRAHPGRGQMIVEDDGLKQRLNTRDCEPEYLDVLWECFAKITDYFADFAHVDTPSMLSIWFHMIDVLQSAVENLPHEFWEKFWEHEMPHCRHAEAFAAEYEDVLKFINNVILPRFSSTVSNDVRANRAVSEPLNVEFRGFKAGLKPWEQYLCYQGPGFDVPYSHQIFSDRARMGAEVLKEWPEQFIPMGALAIMDKHQDRMERLAVEVHREQPETSDKPSEVEILEEFEAHAVDMSEPFVTYTSLDGRHKSAEKMHPFAGTPSAPVRYQGLGDPSCMVEDPDLNLIDEMLGVNKGSTAFFHPDYDERPHFEMLSIRTMETTVPPDPIIDKSDYVDVFDEWTKPTH